MTINPIITMQKDIGSAIIYKWFQTNNEIFEWFVLTLLK